MFRLTTMQNNLSLFSTVRFILKNTIGPAVAKTFTFIGAMSGFVTQMKFLGKAFKVTFGFLDPSYTKTSSFLLSKYEENAPDHIKSSVNYTFETISYSYNQTIEYHKFVQEKFENAHPALKYSYGAICTTYHAYQGYTFAKIWLSPAATISETIKHPGFPSTIEIKTNGITGTINKIKVTAHKVVFAVPEVIPIVKNYNPFLKPSYNLVPDIKPEANFISSTVKFICTLAGGLLGMAVSTWSFMSDEEETDKEETSASEITIVEGYNFTSQVNGEDFINFNIPKLTVSFANHNLYSISIKIVGFGLGAGLGRGAAWYVGKLEENFPIYKEYFLSDSLYKQLYTNNGYNNKVEKMLDYITNIIRFPLLLSPSVSISEDFFINEGCPWEVKCKSSAVGAAFGGLFAYYTPAVLEAISYLHSQCFSEAAKDEDVSGDTQKTCDNSPFILGEADLFESEQQWCEA